MTLFKEYSDILGEPNKGVHEKRIGEFAYYDVLFTLIFIIIISLYFNYNVFTVAIITTLATIIIHWLFGVRTALNKKLNLIE